MTEKEKDFVEKLHSMHSSSVVPAMYIRADGSVLYANRVCMLLYGTDFIENGFAPLVEGDWESIVSEALEDMLPSEIRFKKGNYFADGIISPFEGCDGNMYFSVKTGKSSTPNQPLENLFMFDTAQSAFRTYIEYVADTVDINIRRLGRIIGEDDPLVIELRKTFDEIKQTQQPLKDILCILEKLNNTEHEVICLQEIVDEIARLSGAVRVVPSNTIGVDHIITRGNPALITAALTDLVSKLLPYASGSRVCITVNIEHGEAAVIFNIPGPDMIPEGRYIYTLDDDIYNENHEAIYRLIKANGGNMTARRSHVGFDTVCFFPLDKHSLEYTLSIRRRITDHAVVVNAVRALKLLKIRLKRK